MILFQRENFFLKCILLWMICDFILFFKKYLDLKMFNQNFITGWIKPCPGPVLDIRSPPPPPTPNKKHLKKYDS